MGDGRRALRVEKEIQHCVANFLLKGFKLPLKGLVSISRVEMTEKMRTAKVFVSVMGSDDQKEYTIDTLNENVYDIQKAVNQALRMKFMPKISLVLDEGLERLLKVETALREIAKSQKSDRE